MRLKITLKLTNDRNDTLEQTFERDFEEYEGGNKEEAEKFGKWVAKELEQMVDLNE